MNQTYGTLVQIAPGTFTWTPTPAASGGAVRAGGTHIVGERGFEYIVPAKEARALVERVSLEQTLDLLVTASQDLAQALRDHHAASTEPVA